MVAVPAGTGQRRASSSSGASKTVLVTAIWEA
jgi:hypothetical protein